MNKIVSFPLPLFPSLFSSPPTLSSSPSSSSSTSLSSTPSSSSSLLISIFLSNHCYILLQIVKVKWGERMAPTCGGKDTP
jgi:hypothetical protein